MRVRISDIGPGLHPSERTVRIRTPSDEVSVVVDRDSIHDLSLDISIVREEDGFVLVELPREACDGAWRIWVSSEEVVEGA